jgi:hypothetical protein
MVFMIKFRIPLAIIILLLGYQNVSPAINFKDIHGRWRLAYGGNFGYEFRFNKSYRALCILYLRSCAYVFKGVYTIEEGSRIRINISEMKNDPNVSSPNLHGNFNKTSSSYFIFEGEIKKNKNKKTLELKPVKIIIDSNSDEGKFEPLIRLESI